MSLARMGTSVEFVGDEVAVVVMVVRLRYLRRPGWQARRRGRQGCPRAGCCRVVGQSQRASPSPRRDDSRGLVFGGKAGQAIAAGG